jgi:hypothetical protein
MTLRRRLRRQRLRWAWHKFWGNQAIRQSRYQADRAEQHWLELERIAGEMSMLSGRARA